MTMIPASADAGLRSLAEVPDRGPAVAPSFRLFVLQAHRQTRELSWFDRIGHRLARHWQRHMDNPVADLRRRAAEILAAATGLFALDDQALQAELQCRALAVRSAGAESEDINNGAMAGAVAAVQRVTKLTPHPEQVMGALALLECYVAEMATGEGKTLTAGLAAVCAAWRGWPCHVVTANDYLARRDAELFAKLYGFCGLSVTHIDGETPPPARVAAHNHDVVYTTAKEMLGDYLRDRLALGKHFSRIALALQELGAQSSEPGQGQVVMRGLYQVIVDEADSVLIDEAVTPLIISMPHPDAAVEQAARDAVLLARSLVEKEDFRVNRALRHAELTNAGKARLAALTSCFSAFWQSAARSQEVVEQALYALHLLVRDQHYVIRDDKIVLVDELTGRLAEQRTLSLGMQQVLEAAENLPISPPSEVSARLSFQRFFRLFPRMGGMTGTAAEARAELLNVYRLPTLSIPTHRPVQRSHLPLQLFATEEAKFGAIIAAALDLAAAGRAVLIGMRSVRSSEALLSCLQDVAPEIAAAVELLHAVNHQMESKIVERAGRMGAITIATNMAGRGTDIALAPSVRAAGGLHVIIGEPNDFGRIDRQLLGRCARQGDPGSVQTFVCFGDEVLRRFLPAPLLKLWQKLYQSRPALATALAPKCLWLAQFQAERSSYRQRQNILEQDIQLDKIGF